MPTVTPADLHVEVRELSKSECCDKHIERDKHREHDNRTPRPDARGKGDDQEWQTDLEGDHERCSDHGRHDRVELDRTEVQNKDVCGNRIENVQCEEGKGEYNRGSAEFWEFVVVHPTAGCQPPQTHSGCLPSVPRGAAQRLRRHYRALMETARGTPSRWSTTAEAPDEVSLQGSSGAPGTAVDLPRVASVSAVLSTSGGFATRQDRPVQGSRPVVVSKRRGSDESV